MNYLDIRLAVAPRIRLTVQYSTNQLISVFLRSAQVYLIWLLIVLFYITKVTELSCSVFSAQEDGVVIFPEEIHPGSRKLSNARSTFSSRQGVDRLERSGSPTFIINGRLPQDPNAASITDLHSRDPRPTAGGSEPRIHTLMPSIHSTLPSLQNQLTCDQVPCTNATELRVLEQRIDNIETRLVAMEERLTEKFETILLHLRRKDSGSAPELRNTNVWQHIASDLITCQSRAFVHVTFIGSTTCLN